MLARGEPLLAKAGTAPTTFTLHDADHSFRVAEWIADIAPDEVIESISAYDLGMMLLAAYLHDIGMTPSEGRVDAHFAYLAFADGDKLDAGERDQFDQWLDDYGDGPPSGAARLTAPHLQRCRELVSSYCRYRHNVWSAVWMRLQLADLSLGNYREWLDDLVMICLSHHEGYRELIESRFDPKPVDSPPIVVHPRYIATALRVADVLDIDPERTPEIVFRHRLVDPGSEIFWYRDHAITIAKEESSILVRSRPPNAYVHRAVEQVVDSIDQELRCARAVSEATHFGVAPGREAALPHRWELSSAVFRDIEPRDGAYVYINGSFRPDTEKLLSLLGGLELYGTQFATVRELLQNAFDAVRQQIAWQQIRSPGAARQPQSLALLHEVRLGVRRDQDGWWLVCRDTGVGMTKEILERRLLVSGAQRRHDVKRLARFCREKDIPFAQTGKFGIGVLSYFMLADKVRLVTRRAVAAGDSESTGWEFETEGVGTFGELRPCDSPDEGTEVALHLRGLNEEDPAGEDLVQFYVGLREYLATLLVEVPCVFHLEDLTEAGLTGFRKEPGWFVERHDRHDAIVSSVTKLKVPAKTELSISADVVSNALSWRTLESDLPDGLGRFRCDLPIFRLPRGDCLCFMSVEDRDEDELLMLDGSNMPKIFVPPQVHQVGWMGMDVQIEDFAPRPHVDVGIYSVVDFTDAGAGVVSVSRDSFRLSDRGRMAMIAMEQAMWRFVAEFALEPSIYRWLNIRLAVGALAVSRRTLAQDMTDRAGDSSYWAVRRGPGLLAWDHVELPLPAMIADLFNVSITFDGKLLSTPPELEIVRGDGDPRPGRDVLRWRNYFAPPERIVVLDTPTGARPEGLWDVSPTVASVTDEYLSVNPGPFARFFVENERRLLEIALAVFPPEWHDACAIAVEDDILVWNKDHPLPNAVSDEAFRWLEEIAERTNARMPSPDDIRIDEVHGQRDRAAAFLILAISYGDPTQLESLVKSGVVEAVWDECFPGWKDGREPSELTYVSVGFDGASISVKRVQPTSVTQWVTLDVLGEGGLPRPSPAWRGSTVAVHTD